MATVCYDRGLTVDSDGNLEVKLCPDGGLTFDDDGCVRVDERPLARGTIFRNSDQTVPASPGNCLPVQQQLLYNASTDVVRMNVVGASLRPQQAGLYLLRLCQRTDPTGNGRTQLAGNQTPFDLVTMAAIIRVNGAEVAQQRMDHNNRQTHVFDVTRVMPLAVGDVLTGLFTVHHFGGPSLPQVLVGTPAFFMLQAVQLPTQYVGPLA